MSSLPPSPLPPSDDPAQALYFHGQYDVTSVIVTICSALSLYNALELLLLIFTTFKHYSGMYFWSLLVATIGIIPYCVGLTLEYFMITIDWAGRMIDSIGWILMVTGQSVVLYSRLHLLFSDTRILRAVKWMIIIDAIVYHITTTILQYVAIYGNQTVRPAAQRGYMYFEKVQMTGFCVQEFIISGLYIWKTIQLLRVIKKKGSRRTMTQLLLINVVIVIMDIGLLVVEYLDLHVLEQTLKSFIYSVKLKLEFAILGKLVDLVKSSQHSLSDILADVDGYVDETRSTATAETVVQPPSQILHARPKHSTSNSHVPNQHHHDRQISSSTSSIASSAQHRSERQWMTDLEKSVHSTGMIDRNHISPARASDRSIGSRGKGNGKGGGATEHIETVSEAEQMSMPSHLLPTEQGLTKLGRNGSEHGDENKDSDNADENLNVDVMYAEMVREMTRT